MQIQYTVGEYERYGTGCTRSFMIVHFRDGRESVFNVTKQADPLAHVAAELKSGKRGSGRSGRPVRMVLHAHPLEIRRDRPRSPLANHRRARPPARRFSLPFRRTGTRLRSFPDSSPLS